MSNCPKPFCVFLHPYGEARVSNVVFAALPPGAAMGFPGFMFFSLFFLPGFVFFSLFFLIL